VASLAIATRGLTRRFGKLTAVDQLDLNVPAGAVYAFLGPNGAGKSTTIRMLLGLLRPDAGAVELGNRLLRPGDIAPLAGVGALIEAPSLYSHLTGTENLEVTRRLIRAPKARVGAVLETVGLTASASRAVRTYSMGMRQRLGIALALLGEPATMILDEPTNGLDPAGMQEVRELIRVISRENGTTVFLSSHLLAEVEQVATHLAILAGGRLRFEGTLDDLRSCAERHALIRVEDRRAARRILEAGGWNVTEVLPNRLSVPVRDDSEVAAVNEALVHGGQNVFHLSTDGGDLEELFLDLTRSDESDKEVAA